MPTDDTMQPDALFRPLPPADHDAWREAVSRDLRGRTAETLTTRLHEGMDVAPLYTRADGPSAPGYPGLPPYTRGATALPRSPWIICQEHDAADPAEAAREIRADLARGVTGLWLRIAGGIAVRDAGDLDTLLADVPLASTYLAIEAGEGTGAFAAQLAAHADARGIDAHALRGCLGSDPLGTLAANGRLSTSLEDALAAMADLAASTRDAMPDLAAVRVDLRGYHDAGATAVDELAFALATTTAYLRRLASIPDAARAMSFSFAIGRDLFVEAAKLRAARLVWAKVLRACGTGDDTPPMHIHARGAHRTKTRRDPWVNALRATTETVAAVWGGADLVTTPPYDEAIGRSDAAARRLASNTANILARESHLGHVVDPLGGSWYVEHLTDALARAAWERFQAIEALGGMEIALVRGEIQKQTNVAAERHARAIAERRDPIVGVSVYANVEEVPLTRPPRPVTEPTAPAMSGSDPATAPRLQPHRDAERFEALRDRADAYAVRPAVFLAALGSRREYAARAVFARRFFEAGGFAVTGGDEMGDDDAVAEAFATSGAAVAVICSSDDIYAARAPSVAQALGARGAHHVVLAGRPGDQEAELRAAGVETFIHLGANVPDALERVLDAIGGDA